MDEYERAFQSVDTGRTGMQASPAGVMPCDANLCPVSWWLQCQCDGCPKGATLLVHDRFLQNPCVPPPPPKSSSFIFQMTSCHQICIIEAQLGTACTSHPMPLSSPHSRGCTTGKVGPMRIAQLRSACSMALHHITRPHSIGLRCRQDWGHADSAAVRAPGPRPDVREASGDHGAV